MCLDRDGTLMVEKDYLKDPRRVKLLPGVARGLKRLTRSGFSLAVMTNQSGVGRGLMTSRDVERVNGRLEAMLKARGVRISGIYWCPHAPGRRCACRKPKLALLKRAARVEGAPWRGSISVGDKLSDVAFGQRAGGKGILVLTGYGRRSLGQRWHRRPDFVARNFEQAAEWILKHGQRSQTDA